MKKLLIVFCPWSNGRDHMKTWKSEIEAWAQKVKALLQ